MRNVEAAGFTLLEVVVALTLAATVLTAALGVSAAELRASRRAGQAHEMASLADDLLARADLATGSELSAWSGGVTGRFAPSMERYAWRIRTAGVPGHEGLVSVEAEVTGPSSRIAVQTRVARPVDEVVR
ncbi:MAG TPA: type II secretion system protein [Longimicrobium sp.]